ncbi:MAG: flagellin FliC [Magnetococcales bacterium]|nr:flagellin FliC [Magnetococcales bacterium]MBF0322353.1 flagellin FliC [Magnetococcales bacterium]
MAFSIQDSTGQGMINLLGSSKTKMSSLFRQMASGSRVSQAQDGPALLGIISGMTSEIRGNSQAIGNINDGLSLTQVADSGMGQISDSLQQLRELAVQSANGTLTSADRANIQTQADQIQSQISDVVNNTSFNGQSLLNAGQSISLQTGSGSTDQTSLTMPDLSGAFGALDLTTQAGAASAISSIDTSLATLNQSRADIGGAQSGLETSLSNLQNTNVATQSARSSMQDTDYGQASAGLASSTVKQQFNIALMAQMNKLSSNSALGLLQ